MRKILLTSILFFIVLGCAAAKQAGSDAKVCLADPVCRAEAVEKASKAKDIAKDISGMSPIPLSSNLVGGAAYGIVFLYALIKGGKKKREEVPVG